MIKIMTGSLLAVALVCAGSAAFAEGKGMGKGEKGGWAGEACRADAEKLCAGVEPGEGRIIKCLKEHKDQLSAECKAKWEAKKESMMANRPCMADEKKLCAGVEPGEGRIIRCLKEHEADLSAACKEKIAAGMEACKADRDRLCAGVEHGEGRIIACMKQHEADLSEGCRQAMAHKREKGEKGEMKGSHKKGEKAEGAD